ncbi:hypothetical protein ONZ45_g11061 [Pleurotus djamor]|nr:hypothetical protein ONZ45_g11061 [Pleurotus djamor]
METTVSEAIPPSFGLLDTSNDRWERLFMQVEELNQNSDEKTAFKLFFLGRHGQGIHNVAEAKYTTPIWEGHWARLNGDNELVWGPDAELTPLGISQAETAKVAWEAELSNGLRAPDSMYVSPHARAFNTWQITFSGNDRFTQSGPPLVMEACRERFGVHTCDRRRAKAFITPAFPEGVVEEGLTEEDELWTTDVRETTEQVAARVKRVIDHVFNHDPGNFISITSHSGMINGFLTAIGRPFYRLPTGVLLHQFLGHQPLIILRVPQSDACPGSDSTYDIRRGIYLFFSTAVKRGHHFKFLVPVAPSPFINGHDGVPSPLLGCVFLHPGAISGLASYLQ